MIRIFKQGTYFKLGAILKGKVFAKKLILVNKAN